MWRHLSLLALLPVASATAIESRIHRLSRQLEISKQSQNDNAHPTTSRSFTPRNLEEDGDNDNLNQSCELKFIGCLLHSKCVSCFNEINTNNIDWSFVAQDTTCNTILDVLSQRFHKCMYLSNDEEETKTFCETFDNCVVFEGIEDDDDDYYYADDAAAAGTTGSSNTSDDNKNEKKKEINCDELEKCDFDGFKPSYIGDGICHEFVRGCYNHKICGYDGGDCCPDTCQNKSDYAGCGTDGYFCRDPKSTNCTTTYCDDSASGGSSSSSSSDAGKKKDDVKTANCTKDESPYELLQFSSFGDGWEFSNDMNITVKGSDQLTNVYRGKLESGFRGSEILCLANEPTCYEVSISGGSWGNDISWQIKPKAAGAREVASGGSPMHCEFPVAGGTCENSCLGQMHPDASKDKYYQSYSALTSCMQDKCIIQYHACFHDGSCAPCLDDNPPPYCLTNGNYTALVFCSQCNCVQGANTPTRQHFCSAKSKNEIIDDDERDESKQEDGKSKSDEGRIAKCDWEQRKEGMEALTSYTECSKMEVDSLLQLFKFDNDNFGLLDIFENCASLYLDNPYEKSAYKCMQILQDAIDNPAGSITGPDKDTIPVDAIKAIANDLLHNGHDFCDCAAEATKLCPACSDFMQFKILLYESVDACNALDKIDCGAWQEYAGLCTNNIKTRYKGKVNFRSKKQCDYVMNERCGNLGVFPALRQLDCSAEITQESWKMYVDFQNFCMKTTIDPIPESKPNPLPYPTAPPPSPARKPYVPSETKSRPGIPVINPANEPLPDVWPNNSPHKQYVPPEERGRRPFRRFLQICVLGGIGYLLFTKRHLIDFSRFSRFRTSMTRVRNFYPPQYNNYNYGNDSGGDDSGMYESLTLTDMGGSSSFQPPTLPPGPSAYGPSGTVA